MSRGRGVLRVSSISELASGRVRKLPKSKELLESDVQKAILKWASYQNYKGIPLSKLIHHSPNGGKRNVREAKRFQDMGVQSGYPDLTLNIAKGGFNGLFIELKRSTNESLSPNQQWWLDWLNQEGYRAVVCKGLEQAVKEIENYMKLDPKS